MRIDGLNWVLEVKSLRHAVCELDRVFDVNNLLHVHRVIKFNKLLQGKWVFKVNISMQRCG